MGTAPQEREGRPEPPGPPAVQPEQGRPGLGECMKWGAGPGRADRSQGAAETRLPPAPRRRPTAHAHEVSTGLHGDSVTL